MARKIEMKIKGIKKYGYIIKLLIAEMIPQKIIKSNQKINKRRKVWEYIF